MKLNSNFSTEDYEKKVLENLAKRHTFITIIDHDVIAELAEDLTGTKLTQAEKLACADALNEIIDYKTIYKSLENYIIKKYARK